MTVKLDIYEGDKVIHTTQVSDWAKEFIAKGSVYTMKLDGKIIDAEPFRKDGRLALRVTKSKKSPGVDG